MSQPELMNPGSLPELSRKRLNGILAGLIATALTPQMFGAVPNDPDFDNADALDLFFAALPGSHGIIAGGTYYISRKIEINLTNCTLEFLNNSKISGDFGYELVEFTGLTRSFCIRPYFENLYVNAADSGTASVKSGSSCPILDMHFVSPRFTVPYASVNALTFFIRENAGSVINTCKGLYLHEPTFEDCGKLAVTFMNRGAAADRYTSVREVHVYNPIFKNLGLIHPTDGFAVSFDGFGSDWSVEWPDITNARGIALENTGWIDGGFEHVRFRELATSCRPFSFTPYDSAYPMTGCWLEDCLPEDVPTKGSLFRYVNGLKTSGCTWSSSVDEAIAMDDHVFDCLSVDDALYSAGSSCLAVDGASKRNRWVRPVATYAGAGGPQVAFHFNGAGTSQNSVEDAIVTTNHGIASQENSATDNFVIGVTLNVAGVLTYNYESALTLAIADANYTYAEVKRPNFLTVTATWTGSHTFTLLESQFAGGTFFLKNSTGQTMQLAVAGVNGDTIADAATKQLRWDGTTARAI